MDNYCDTCGKKLVETEAVPKKYCRETGKPIIIKICPTGRCGHYGISHEYTSDGRSIFHKLFNLDICKHCGETARRA